MLKKTIVAAIGFIVISALSSASEEQLLGGSKSIVQRILDVEYSFSAEQDGQGWTAPNRGQGLRSRISAKGLRFEPFLESESWGASLYLKGIGYGETLREPAAPQMVAQGSRLELRGPHWTEWFINRPEGLEHGFTLPERLPGQIGNEPLEVHLRVGGSLTPSLESEGLSFKDSDRTVLQYGKLMVFDSMRRTIPARFDLSGDTLRILVDDVDAVYPLTIDPLTTSPVWATTGGQIDSEYSVSLASCDFNSDGFSDLAVGADEFTNDLSSEGRVFVYYGSPTGFSTTPDWYAEGDQVGADFGISVACAGDVDGDTFEDLIVGAHRFDAPESNEGIAVVFYSSATGLDRNGAKPVGGPGNAEWVAEANQAGANFGIAVDGAGDVNGDGYDDILISADEFTAGQTAEGAVFLYYGSLGGLNTGGRPVGNPTNADWVAEGNKVDTDFGFAIAGGGNVNGDLYTDVVIGAWNWDQNFLNEGRFFVYLGSASGPQSTPNLVLEGLQDDARLGISLDTADVNGDGFDDVLVGADSWENGELDEGAAFLFEGSPTGVSNVPAWLAESNQGNSDFGFKVSSAGDVNGDGFEDVLIGAPRYDNVEVDEGRVFLYLGSPTGLQDDAIWTFESDQASAFLGNSLGSAGDIDGDGFDDVVAGADEFDLLLANEGAVFAFTGCSDLDRDGLCLGADNCPSIFNPDQTDSDMDGSGDNCDPCNDEDNDGACDGELIVVDYEGPGERVLVEYDTPMVYLANSTDPFLTVQQWTDPAFVPAGWDAAPYGIGYETVNPGAENLLEETVPQGTNSVYTRATFNIPDVTQVENVFLGADYDDAYVAFINGVEVFRSGEFPLAEPLWNTDPQAHESSNGLVPDYGILKNISVAALPVLVNGDNIFAVGVWNNDASDSTDLVLVPRLSINRPTDSPVRYRANSTDPFLGQTWKEPGFDDSSWSEGNYGVGYDTAGQASDLLLDPVESTALSVYTRTNFFVSLASAGSVFIDADYDDGIVAWINGTEVFRSPEMPIFGPDWNEAPVTTHESSNGALPVFSDRVNITASALGALQDGDNLFAIGAWTVGGAPENDDLVLVPKLSVGGAIIDNCPGLPNPSQLDTDGDGDGNDCDDDDDNDGFLDGADNCPLDFNPDQLNTDGLMDGGDICDDDDDEDTIPDSSDNCRVDVNPLQEDNEMDGIGDVCDPDDDNDQVPDLAPDNCPLDFNRFQEDNDMDGMGDVCDPDDDNDGEPDGTDNCPFTMNVQTDNMDGDDAGDACDCLPMDSTAWRQPSAVNTLMLDVGSPTPLSWSAPADPGAVVVGYDTLRSSTASDFSLPTCLENNDGTDTAASEPGTPGPGGVFYYLIRTDNLCAGEGTVRVDGMNMDRVTGVCP